MSQEWFFFPNFHGNYLFTPSIIENGEIQEKYFLNIFAAIGALKSAIYIHTSVVSYVSNFYGFSASSTRRLPLFRNPKIRNPLFRNHLSGIHFSGWPCFRKTLFLDDSFPEDQFSGRFFPEPFFYK
jgi:hypothetical protein